MSSFGGKNLFGSGRHGFVVSGLHERHVVHEAAGRDGAVVTALGHSGRTVDQEGVLLGDDVGDMEEQFEAIEGMMDGAGHALVDEWGREYGGMVMVAFEPGGIRRVGRRLMAEYRVKYVQSGD